MILFLLFIGACFLAYTNGANDNFKGVATLFGSNITNYKNAITWATATTFAGSIAAIFLASKLTKNFSGKGLVPDELIQMPIFAISIALGAALTVFLATKIGMPISTTHGLVGALFGTGLMAVGADFNFAKLGSTFLIPLLISPLMAATFSFFGYLFFRFVRIKTGITKSSCICINEVPEINIIPNSNAFVASLTNLKIAKCDKETNTVKYDGEILGITIQKIMDNLHFLSAGVVSFARGLNDTPKIVGLLIVINAFNVQWGMLALGVAMAVGGLINAKKVGITMSKKITPMNSGQGFTANLVTGLLVTTASIHGLPVSTTHVSVGSIFGIGTVTKQADFRVVSKIVLSWVLTLPIAALFGALIFSLLKFIG
ncbi:MAG TPA: anion permease [Gillisia sp.]|nr:anion permease [Gillisia sp.]